KVGKFLNRRSKIWALRWAMRRPSPLMIPVSDLERMRRRNYATVHLGDSDHPYRFLVRSVEAAHASGLWFFGEDSRSEERAIALNEICNFDLRVTYYFHEIDLRYGSAWSYLLARLTFHPHRSLWGLRFRRALYARKTLLRSDRIT